MVNLGDTVSVDIDGETVKGTILTVEQNEDDGISVEVEVNGVASIFDASEVHGENGESLYDDDFINLIPEPEPREDHFRDDVEADADTLAGAGYGTDEDYGYYGGEDE